MTSAIGPYSEPHVLIGLFAERIELLAYNSIAERNDSVKRKLYKIKQTKRKIRSMVTIVIGLKDVGSVYSKKITFLLFIFL